MQATTPLSLPDRGTFKRWKQQIHLKCKQQLHCPSPTAGHQNVEKNNSISNASNNPTVPAWPQDS